MNSLMLLLTCTSLPFTDLQKVEVVRDDGDLIGMVMVIEYDATGRHTFNAIEPRAFSEGKIPLSDWNGYKRSIEKLSPSKWAVTHQDECSGGITRISCVEGQ